MIQRFRNISIRRKVVWLVLLSSLLALALTMVALLIYEFAVFKEDALRSLSAEADVIAMTSQPALDFDDQKMAQENLGTIRANQQIVAGCIYDKAGKIYVRYVRPEMADFRFPEPRPAGYRFENNSLLLFRDVRSGNETVGKVFLRFDLQSPFAALPHYAVILGSISLVLLGVAFLSAALLQRLISIPILNLAKSATVVSEKKDFSVRVEKTSEDEIGLLADTFNQMLGAIQSRERSLRDVNHELRNREHALQIELTERRRVEQALRESEERFRLIVERASDYAIVTLDLDGCVSSWNIGAQRIFGYSEDEILGQNAAILFTAEDRASGLPEKELERARETGHASDERAHPRKDGSRFWASGYLIALSDEKNRLRGFAKIMRDFTERKKMEDALQQSKDQLALYAGELEQRVNERTASLRETIDYLQGFCYTIAHDLRAPLRSMSGYASALLEDYGPKLNDEGSHYAQRIIDSATRMDQLMMDLLAFGRLSQIELTFSVLDLDSEVESVVAAMAENIQAAEGQIVIRPKMPRVVGNETVLEQALTNLISNALKFARQDIPPRIEISAETRGEMVRISVEDNGIGIPAEHRERIFRVFERLHPERKYSGTGIGLAIVKRGVERMKGQVGVESEVGKGSCFWVELPKANGMTG